MKTEFTKTENRIAQLEDVITRIYEDKVSGDLSAERFTKMLTRYEREQAELTVKLDELQPLIDEFEEKSLSTDRFLGIVKSYTEIDT